MEEKERKRAFELCVVSGVLLLALLIYSVATKNWTNALTSALFLLSFFIWMRLFRIQYSCIQMQETQLQERPYTSWRDHEYTPDEIVEIAKEYSDRTEDAVVLSVGDKENNSVRSVTQGIGIDVLVCLTNLFLKKDTRKLARMAIGCAEEDEKKQGGV